MVTRLQRLICTYATETSLPLYFLQAIRSRGPCALFLCGWTNDSGMSLFRLWCTDSDLFFCPFRSHGSLFILNVLAHPLRNIISTYSSLSWNLSVYMQYSISYLSACQKTNLTVSFPLFLLCLLPSLDFSFSMKRYLYLYQ